MKPFDEWLDDFTQGMQVELPDGVRESTTDGVFEARCVCCDQWTELWCDVSEVPLRGYRHYCSGSPWCLP